MRIGSIHTVSGLPLVLVVTAGCVGLGSGCAEQSRTVFEFKDPKIFLHAYEEPAKVRSGLRTEGPRIQTRDELGNANADFVITGIGVVHWGSREINVTRESINIDGTLIESRNEGYRNVVADKDGSVKKDQFIPFEPRRGYHPNKKP